MKATSAATALLISLGGVAEAEFVGNLVLIPQGCEQTYRCTLEKPFGYIDKNDIGWEADSGDITDGASIPKWSRFFAGEPFEISYLPAAVLHDHYSKSVRPVRGWFSTQVMFHDVLIESGVPKDKVAILFAGVLIGSGKWLKAQAGKPCPTIRGVACINVDTPGEEMIVRQDPSFGSTEYDEIFKKLAQRIREDEVYDPIPITEIARELMPGNIFLENTGGTLGTQIH